MRRSTALDAPHFTIVSLTLSRVILSHNISQITPPKAFSALLIFGRFSALGPGMASDVPADGERWDSSRADREPFAAVVDWLIPLRLG